MTSQALGDHALLDRVDAMKAAAAMRELSRVAGLPLSPSSAALARLLEAVGSGRTSEPGSAEVPEGPDESLFRLTDPVPITEAAAMLNTTRRNATDLCLRGSLRSARKLGGRWLVERSEILARVAA